MSTLGGIGHIDRIRCCGGAGHPRLGNLCLDLMEASDISRDFSQHGRRTQAQVSRDCGPCDLVKKGMRADVRTPLMYIDIPFVLSNRSEGMLSRLTTC
jgi:hypothetical protein